MEYNEALVLLSSFSNNLYKNFIAEERYLLILRGLSNTVVLSLMAAVFGLIIGIFITFCRLSKGPLRWFANIYLDIIRGTPSFTQILVIYFVIFASFDINKLLAGSIAFGINSGAYVSEIIRAGILSIDKGQTEAGRSLGLSGAQTMRYIVLPQAVKNILPALTNEFIVLIKETAVAGYIGVVDLTKAAMLIQSRTYNTSIPYIGSAVIYYLLIKLLTIIFNKLEHRLRKADTR